MDTCSAVGKTNATHTRITAQQHLLLRISNKYSTVLVLFFKRMRVTNVRHGKKFSHNRRKLR